MEEKYYTLIHKCLSGDATDKERELLKRWISASGDNRKIFEEYQKVWDELSPAQPKEQFSIDDGWKEIENFLSMQSEKIQENIEPVKQKRMMEWFQYFSLSRAAALVLPAILLISIYLFVFNSSSDNLESYTTRRGERKEIILPDQSMVKLNVDSRIEFPEKFSSSERVVKLYGEAFFEVIHDGYPFIVKTENASINVLGTQFNVSSRDKKTEVIVRNGKVVLQNVTSPSGNKVVLTEDQMSTCIGNLDPDLPHSVSSRDLLGWLENRIVFTKKPLNEISKELERVFNVTIKLANPLISSLSVSGTFEEKNVESILSEICLTLNLQYEYKNGTYRISLK